MLETLETPLTTILEEWNGAQEPRLNQRENGPKVLLLRLAPGESYRPRRLSYSFPKESDSVSFLVSFEFSFRTRDGIVGDQRKVERKRREKEREKMSSPVVIISKTTVPKNVS